MFGHEKFGAYQKAIEYVAEVFKIIELVPKGNANIVDQLKRASISIPLNIAEGTGKLSQADKRRFYIIARGSAMECAAILDLFKIMYEMSAEELQKATKLLEEVAAILSKICKP